MSKSKLVTQETRLPTRKVLAAGVSTLLFAGLMATITHFFPGMLPFIDTSTLHFSIELLIYALPGLFATLNAYIVREWGFNADQVSTDKENSLE